MSFIPNKNMHAIKIVCRFKPPTIGIVYKHKPTDKKKKLYYIELNGLESLNDSSRVTELLFKFYPHILNEKNVQISQIEENVKLILDNLKLSPDQTINPMFSNYSQNKNAEYSREEQTEEIDLDQNNLSNAESLTYSSKYKSNLKSSSGQLNDHHSGKVQKTNESLYDREFNKTNVGRNQSRVKDPSPFSYSVEEDEFQIEDLL